MSQRLNFVDVARSWAIALALFSHGMLTFGGWRVYGNLPTRTFVRSATPLFVFMFGMMLELAYVRRARRDGPASVDSRLLRRSWQCYVGFAVAAVAAVVGGYYGMDGALRALTFLQNAPLGNILRLYAVALLIAPVLVRLRLRSGAPTLLALLIALWVLDALLLEPLAGRSFGPLTPWVGILLGTGSFEVGPSVYHAFTFILAGMLAGATLDGWRDRGMGAFYAWSGVLLVVCVAVAGTLAFGGLGIRGLFESFVEYSRFRATNHIGYYAVGTGLCVSTLVLLSVAVPEDHMPGWWGAPTEFGRSSLFSYAAGNTLLVLIPVHVASGLGEVAPFLAAGFVLVVLGLANIRRVMRATSVAPAPGT